MNASSSPRYEFRRPSPLVNTRRETAFLTHIAETPLLPGSREVNAASDATTAAATDDGSILRSPKRSGEASPTALAASPTPAASKRVTIVDGQTGAAATAAAAADECAQGDGVSSTSSPTRQLKRKDSGGSLASGGSKAPGPHLVESKHLSFLPHLREMAFLTSLGDSAALGVGSGTPVDVSSVSSGKLLAAAAAAAAVAAQAGAASPPGSQVCSPRTPTVLSFAGVVSGAGSGVGGSVNASLTADQLAKLSFLPEFQAVVSGTGPTTPGGGGGPTLRRNSSSVAQLMLKDDLDRHLNATFVGSAAVTPTMAMSAAIGDDGLFAAGLATEADAMLLRNLSAPIGSGRRAYRRLHPEGVPFLVRRDGDCVRIRTVRRHNSDATNVKSAGRPLFVSTILADFGANSRKKATPYDALVDDPPEALELKEDPAEHGGSASHTPSRTSSFHGKARNAFARVVTKTSEAKKEEDQRYYGHLLSLHHDPAHSREEDPFYSDPFFLDNPDIKGERRRKVMAAPGYRCSIVPFVDSKIIDKDIDEQFYLRHPQLQQRELKLTSIRKIKRNLLLLAIEEHSPLEIGTIAFAICYFERLVLKLLVTPENRKLVACVCTVLAVKFAETGISSKVTMDKKLEYAFTRLFDLFGVSKARILRAEFRVFAGLEFDLLLPQEELVMAQVERLLAGINLTPAEYFRVKKRGEVGEEVVDADDDDD